MDDELIGRVILRTGHIIIDGEVFKLDTLFNVVKARLKMDMTFNKRRV